MIFYETQYAGYSSKNALLPPLNAVNDIDAPEEQIKNQSYLQSSIYKKIGPGTLPSSKMNFGGLNCKVICKLLYPYLPEYSKMLNYGGYGLSKDGEFYFDYNDIAADEFSNDPSKDHKDERRIIGHIDDSGKATLTVVDGIDQMPYTIKTKANSRTNTNSHSAAALIYGIISMILIKVERGLINVGDKGYEVASTIYNHFKDLAEAIKSGGDEDKVIAATRCLDLDIYSLFSFPDEIVQDIGSTCIVNRRYDTDTYKQLDLSDIPEMEAVYGSSVYLEGRRALNSKGEMLKDDEITQTVGELLTADKDAYALNPSRVLTPEELALVPNKSEMIPNKEIIQKIKLIKESTSLPRPFRNILWTGETGSGKSTACAIAAQMLGLPYVFITINPDTLLSDLYVNYLPNTNKGMTREQISKLAESYPDFMDCSISPADSYLKITGQVKEDATENDCLQAILSDMSSKVNETGDFMCVKSQLVKAVEQGWFVEIQEANLASKPGVLGGINALMDDLGTIVLPTGEIIHRHPDTVICMTANVDYEGTRKLNQAVKSRLPLKGVFELPEDSKLVKTVKMDSGLDDERTIQDMIKVMRAIRKVLNENGTSDGSCGLREIVAWAQATVVLGYDNIYEAAEATIIPSATDDSDVRAAVEEAVATQFAPSEWR